MSKPHIPWPIGLINFCKYTRFQYTLFLPLIAVWSALFSSCSSSSNVITIPLTPMELDDKRFLDTLEESTLFYFDIFNFDGYDRFGNMIFEDLKYRLTSRSSVEFPETDIASFEGAMFREGLHTRYVVYGIFKNEPTLIKRVDSSSVNPFKEEIKPAELNIPASVSLLIASKNTIKDSQIAAVENNSQTTTVSAQNQDMRLIIIACFRESYFEESMMQNYYNDLSELDYYKANGWVRIYLKDFPGYRIYEAIEVFPEAWRANYGE